MKGSLGNEIYLLNEIKKKKDLFPIASGVVYY